MPTVHPRLALTRDPELDDALRRAALLLGDMPAATVARKLILRGAQDLLASSGPEVDRWLLERGATPATRSTDEILSAARELPAADPANPRPLSDALAELREERI